MGSVLTLVLLVQVGGQDSPGRFLDRDYDGADRFYGTTREDVRAGVRLTAYYTLSARVQIIVEGEAEWNDSNISDFDYGREVIAVGVLVAF